MKLLKSLVLSAATVLIAAGVAAAQEKEWTTVRIGTEGAYPPFNYTTPDGQLAGFDIDIAKALCEEMKVQCEFVTQDWDGIIPALLAGKYDAIVASMSITEERKQQVDFTNKYYNTPPAIAVPKDSELTEVTPEALEGKILGAQGSTTHATFGEQTFPGAEIKLYPTSEEYKLDLESGRLDAAIDDVVVLSQWIDSPDGECCKILGTMTPDPAVYGEGIGIALRKEDAALKEKLNAAIQAIRESGEYKEINDKYFAFDVYGS